MTEPKFQDLGAWLESRPVSTLVDRMREEATATPTSSRFAGRMAASDADRVIRQALASLPTSHLETALASLSAGDLGKATASDRAHVLHTIGLVEEALALTRYSDNVRAAFARQA